MTARTSSLKLMLAPSEIRTPSSVKQGVDRAATRRRGFRSGFIWRYSRTVSSSGEQITIPRLPSTTRRSPEDIPEMSSTPITAGISSERAMIAVCDSGLPVSMTRPTTWLDRSSKRVDGGIVLPAIIASKGSLGSVGVDFARRLWSSRRTISSRSPRRSRRYSSCSRS